MSLHPSLYVNDDDDNNLVDAFGNDLEVWVHGMKYGSIKTLIILKIIFYCIMLISFVDLSYSSQFFLILQ